MHQLRFRAVVLTIGVLFLSTIDYAFSQTIRVERL
ncbi:MAG: hypothetical protein CM1200mP25_5060 [Acidobacteriota bacterium]|nr:MAG: hypothetical protein CM1200mP25_5060 [Acidobacteriota bacterium]